MALLSLPITDRQRSVIRRVEADDGDDEYASYYDYCENNTKSDQKVLAVGSEITLTKLQIVADKQGRYVCRCGRTYKEDRYLRHHQRWECGKPPTFRCPLCEYQAKRNNSLKAHLKRIHSRQTECANQINI